MKKAAPSSIACSILALLLLSACGGLKTYHTVLVPSQTAESCKGNQDWSDAAYCVGLNVKGDCPQGGVLTDLKGKPPSVGFQRFYDPGTSPLPCWSWVSTVTRGYANFNLLTLPKIQKVVVAKLTWDPEPPGCFKRLFEATGPWQPWSTPGNLISDELDQPTLAKGISGTPLQAVVQKWVDSGNHFGFFFTATDESLPEKQNKTCMTKLQSLKLELTYEGKPETFPQ